MIWTYEDMVHFTTNLFLGGTTGNVTPQIYMTHPTLGQNRFHRKKAFHFKLFIKCLLKSCRIKKST